MKIGLIIPANEGFQPFVTIFKKILDKENVEYESVIWDRMNMEENGIVFHRSSAPAQNNILKLLNYAGFARFAAKVSKKRQYDKLIIFGPQLALFMYPFLKKHYNKKFWMDYRDLSIEQKCMGLYKKVLEISEYISISSPGFKKALPDGYDYILSHNFDINEIRDVLQKTCERKKSSDIITISTIGSIRDFDANAEIIDNIKNNPNIKLRFIGKGIASESLHNYAKNVNAKNVEFKGYYDKSIEHTFYEETDFVNIYYPHLLSHDTALSNRFYKSLVFKKPMIVRSKSIQGDYVEKYNLGLSLDNCTDLQEKLTSFTVDDKFETRCNSLLREFAEDYDIFENKFIHFIKH